MTATANIEPQDQAVVRSTVNIPDHVLQAGIAGYAPADRDDLQWLLAWAAAELDNSRDRLCEMLGADYTTLVRVCTGKYPSSIAPFMQKVRDVRRRATESVGTAGYVETIVSRKIWETLDYALAGDLDGGRLVMISGHTRRGKTAAVREWLRRNNHGTSVYVDAPESGGQRLFLQEIGRQLRISADRPTAQLWDRINASFNRRRILIVDEVLRFLPRGHHGPKAPPQLEFLRRLHDTRRCAVALIATPVFAREMDSGNLRDYLEQLLGRIAEPLTIPDRVYRSEVRQILASLVPSPADDLVDLATTIANQPGRLGIMFELLRQAQALAKRRREPLALKHLSAANARRRSRFDWPAE